MKLSSKRAPRRIALAGALSALILGTTPLAAQEEMKHWYLGASAGLAVQQDACDGLETVGFVGSCDDSDAGWKVYGGYQFTEHWGAEAGYVDLGESSINGTVFGAAATAAAEVTGFQVAGTATLPFGEGFGAFGKLGAFVWDVDSSATVGGATASLSDDGVTGMVGLGLRYDFAESFGVRAEWERFIEVGDSDTIGEADVDLFSAGLNFRF